MKRLLENPRLLGLVMLFAYSGFALLPNTFFNWFYDYLAFLPWWGVLACLTLAAGVALLPQLSFRKQCVAVFFFAVALPFCFYLFRTRVHCFGGDMGSGCLPGDLTISWSSLIPPLPGRGRLDTYGYSPLFKFMLSRGWLDGFEGMATMVGFGLYDIIVGFLFVLISVALFFRSPLVLLMILTSPFVFNFFGNVDCYPLPICAAMVFLALTRSVFSREVPSFPQVIAYGLYWLFCGWVHPIAGVVGFLPAIIAVRWLNAKQKRVNVPERVPVIAFGLLFFVINIVSYGKSFFSAPWNDVPPVFSIDTVIHTVNIVILPILPIATFVLLGPAPSKDKRLCVYVYLAQVTCFCATHFTQGANDQFPYSLYLIGVMIPWLSLALRFPLDYRPLMCVIALNLLLLVPMVWVHSTDLTIDRALCLYPLDRCKHNKEMSWQTHLGLILGDNLVDNAKHRKATLQVFENGARKAEPSGFRGGNYLYYTAFLYHFGEFERGRQQLAGLIRTDPSLVRYFLSTRPGFAYLNRQRLWDDLYDLFPQSPAKPQLKRTLDTLREQAAKERYCVKNPACSVCPY